jgi:TetR/AcrR family transcriptional regulator of autoinduction and epiphytic fitness
VALDEQAVDGRVLRGERTKEAIVDALVSLVEEGKLQPTGADVAKRAGVSLRSVRLHFPTREALLLAAAQRRSELLPPMAPVHVEGGDRRALLHAFVHARAAYLEATGPIRRAGAAFEAQSHAIKKVARMVRSERRRVTAETFAEAVAAEPAATRDQLLDALDAASSGLFWDSLRLELRLSIEDASAVMTRTIGALLGVRAASPKVASSAPPRR